MNDPNKQWNEADVDKGGMILFSEFSEWAIRQNLSLGNNDPTDQIETGY